MEDNTVKMLKALADQTRFNILETLLVKNYCVSALAKELSLSESAVSQHLKILRKADLVIGEKRGYYTHYLVKRENLEKLAENINKLAQKECGECKDCC